MYSIYFSKLIFISVILCAFSLNSQTIVETHGRLQVQGNQIVDENLSPISIAGNSLFWSTAGDSADFYNFETVDFLAENWNSSVIRCAMGINEVWDGGTGYINNPIGQKAKISTVIDAAIAKGIYVIIDWHTHEAEVYQDEAVAFFTEMASIYGDEPNVIYEIYNEPINQSWSTIKNYAEAVIAGIRSEDPDNLIIVGTPFYSQEVDVASLDPINDVNTAYTLHFYAGTHGDNLRNKAITALNNGIALFVTEWGSVNADGNGNPDIEGTETWIEFLKENNLSHANWTVSDKNEGSSIVQNNSGVDGLLNDELTESGFLIRDIIQNWNNSSDPPNDDPIVITCNTIDCIRNAMATAQPGDEIIIADGIYQMTDKIDGAFGRDSYLYASSNGTEANPIILRGENSSNPAIISGINYQNGYLLSIDGDFWNIQDLKFRTGSKGIILDNANNTRLINLEVYDVGDEAIHFRDGSSNNLVNGCEIYDTGRSQPGFGEAIYVGSDKGQHDQYNPECNNNTIENSIIGPNVTAEGVDVKEGTENTIVRNCVFSAAGISGVNSADAFIDLKGAYGFIYNNTFNLDGSTIINAGIDFLDRGTNFNTGFRNAIFNNTFNLENRGLEVPTARKKQGDPVETHVWDNIRIPDTEDFPISNGTINYVSEFCPQWNILPCDPTNGNEIPTVAFTTPQDNLTVEEGYSSLSLVASATDADGTIADVGLYIEDVFVRDETVSPYEFGSGDNTDETLGLSAGTYTFKVIATDDQGATSEDTFLLTVTATPNQAPSVAFTTPQDNLTVEEGYSSLSLVASATDADGTIADVGLYIDDVFVRDETVSPYEFGSGDNTDETLGLSAGTYTFKVIATDDQGATSEDTFLLTVDAVLSNTSNEIEKKEIKIYPNPAKTLFYVFGIPETGGSLQIVDMLGRVVLVSNKIDQFTPVDISSLTNSNYLLIIEFDNSVFSKKLVKISGRN